VRASSSSVDVKHESDYEVIIERTYSNQHEADKSCDGVIAIMCVNDTDSLKTLRLCFLNRLHELDASCFMQIEEVNYEEAEFYESEQAYSGDENNTEYSQHSTEPNEDGQPAVVHADISTTVGFLFHRITIRKTNHIQLSHTSPFLLRSVQNPIVKWGQSWKARKKDGVAVYLCGYCAFYSARYDLVRSHHAEEHSLAVEMHPCPQCDKSYTRKDNMRTHCLNAHGSYP
jgi:hypothetical protein